GVSAGMRSRVRNVLQHRKISVISGVRVTKADQHGLSTADGRSFPADVVVWAAEAAPSDFLRSVPLPHDERGFLLTDHTLRSISGDPVFAVGDCGSIERAALPKAGVYAVRQGPILWTNLQRILRGQPLQTYRPQRSFLKLLNTGDGSAVGEWKGLSFSGRWVMKLKHRIDTRFMNMYQPQPMTVTAAEMQCRGCGCKVGSDVLLSALDHTQTQVRAERSPGGIADLANMRTAERSAPAQHAVSSVTPSMPDAVRDDAAVIRLHNGGTVLASVDFFTPPFDDPFLNGRIAALHAAGDLFASGAAVKSALANVVLPEGSPQAQQQALSDFLAGAEREFRSMGAGIVGGHTISGPRWETGFTVLGEPLGGELIRKNGLQTGDVLLLTKPLGVGVLLSAHMRAALPAEDYANLLQHLLQSSRPAGEAAVRCGVTAGTDVTGFGLLGHLTEMLNASGLAAELSLRSVPLLPGTEELLRNGFESSLAPSNETFLQHCRFPYNSDSKGDNTNIFIRAMIDPQTCGGLLLGMSAKRATEYTAAITTAGLPQPAQIGRVTERTMEWIISAD
ncbi:MAG: selenide, water dikinase SelD, partial [Planctomycetaceae bacterium]|nr:selenide, water dikinase SelD [Planctomycetaceae bacterium]